MGKDGGTDPHAFRADRDTEGSGGWLGAVLAPWPGLLGPHSPLRSQGCLLAVAML